MGVKRDRSKNKERDTGGMSSFTGKGWGVAAGGGGLKAGSRRGPKV